MDFGGEWWRIMVVLWGIAMLNSDFSGEWW